jgi:hypothetical protein
MKITNLKELEEARNIVLQMRAEATHPYVIQVFDLMLEELDEGDVENIYTPSFLSIQNFGYDIFQDLHRI